MAFLDVLAVVALGVRQPEEPLLEHRVPPVPERDGEAQPAFAVSEPEEPVLAPPVRARARVLVREIAPALPVRGVVLTHRAPLPLGQVRAPALPVLPAGLVVGEAGLLSVGGCSGHRGSPPSPRSPAQAIPGALPVG